MRTFLIFLLSAFAVFGQGIGLGPTNSVLGMNTNATVGRATEWKQVQGSGGITVTVGKTNMTIDGSGVASAANTNLPAGQKITNLQAVAGITLDGTNILALMSAGVTNLPNGQQLTNPAIYGAIGSTNLDERISTASNGCLSAAQSITNLPPGQQLTNPVISGPIDSTNLTLRMSATSNGCVSVAQGMTNLPDFVQLLRPQILSNWWMDIATADAARLSFTNYGNGIAGFHLWNGTETRRPLFLKWESGNPATIVFSSGDAGVPRIMFSNMTSTLLGVNSQGYLEAAFVSWYLTNFFATNGSFYGTNAFAGLLTLDGTDIRTVMNSRTNLRAFDSITLDMSGTGGDFYWLTNTSGTLQLWGRNAFEEIDTKFLEIPGGSGDLWLRGYPHSNSLGTAAYQPVAAFQPATANGTNWGNLSTNGAIFSQNIGTAAYSNANQFQVAGSYVAQSDTNGMALVVSNGCILEASNMTVTASNALWLASSNAILGASNTVQLAASNSVLTASNALVTYTSNGLVTVSNAATLNASNMVVTASNAANANLAAKLNFPSLTVTNAITWRLQTFLTNGGTTNYIVNATNSAHTTVAPATNVCILDLTNYTSGSETRPSFEVFNGNAFNITCSVSTVAWRIATNQTNPTIIAPGQYVVYSTRCKGGATNNFIGWAVFQ